MAYEPIVDRIVQTKADGTVVRFIRGFINSDDPKPVTGIYDRSELYERDTGKWYLFNMSMGEWFVPDDNTGGGSGGGSGDVAADKVIASAYSTSGAYSAGSYVTKGGKLYKAKQAVSNEPWTAAHWEETKIMNEVSSIEPGTVLPDPSTGTNGMVVSVNNGEYVLADAPQGSGDSELPDPSQATEGNVLTVHNGEWVASAPQGGGSGGASDSDDVANNSNVSGATVSAALNTLNSSKMANPTNAGTANQVLVNDGQGGTAWANAVSDETIAAAVSNWLEDDNSFEGLTFNPEQINGVQKIGGGTNYWTFVDEYETGKKTTGSVGSHVTIGDSATAYYVRIPITEHGVYYFYVDGEPATAGYIKLTDANGIVLFSATNQTSVDASNENGAYLYLTFNTNRNPYENMSVGLGGVPSAPTYHVSGTWSFENLELESDEDEPGAETPLHIYLPPEICVGVGRTIELYNHLVFLEDSKYHMYWTCSDGSNQIGTAYSNKFSVTGTAATIGNYDLNLYIYDDNLTLVHTATSTLKIVDNSLTGTHYILPIGASMTCNRVWLTEVPTLSNNAIQFVGTRGATGYNHEGRAGWSIMKYLGDNTYSYDTQYHGNPNFDGSANPFWDGTQFSLQYYLTNQGSYLTGTPEAVMTFIGSNQLTADPTEQRNAFRTFVNSIHTEFPNMPIFIGNTLYRSTQDGYYETGGEGYVNISTFEYRQDMYIMRLQTALAEEFANDANVFIVPCSITNDRWNNFTKFTNDGHQVPVNPRIPEVTVRIPEQSVHPQAAGYLQMADVMYSSLIAHLS